MVLLAIFDSLEWVDRLRWRPGIGDPTVLGWSTAAGYAVVAGLCLWAARATAGDRWKWRLVAIVMAILAVNKQLDLQSLLTDIGRTIARQDGWYRERRAIQQTAVLVALAMAGLLTGLAVFLDRRFWQRHLLLGFGMLVLLTFVAVRALSFHHVDVLLRSRVIGVKMNAILEIGGLTLIGVAAWRARGSRQ